MKIDHLIRIVAEMETREARAGGALSTRAASQAAGQSIGKQIASGLPAADQKAAIDQAKRQAASQQSQAALKARAGQTKPSAAPAATGTSGTAGTNAPTASSTTGTNAPAAPTGGTTLGQKAASALKTAATKDISGTLGKIGASAGRIAGGLARTAGAIPGAAVGAAQAGARGFNAARAAVAGDRPVGGGSTQPRGAVSGVSAPTSSIASNTPTQSPAQAHSAQQAHDVISDLRSNLDKLDNLLR